MFSLQPPRHTSTLPTAVDFTVECEWLSRVDLAFALCLLPLKEIGLRHWVVHLQDFLDLYVLALHA